MDIASLESKKGHGRPLSRPEETGWTSPQAVFNQVMAPDAVGFLTHL
jgi:hypothetical protein